MWWFLLFEMTPFLFDFVFSLGSIYVMGGPFAWKIAERYFA